MNLREYQQVIRSQLSHPSGDLMLVAPAGSGVRGIVARAIKEWSATGLVVILTDRVDIGYQWSESLKQIGQITRILTGTEDVLAAGDSSPNEVVIGTLQRMGIGVGRRYLESVAPAVAVIDSGTVTGDQAKQIVFLLRAKKTRVVLIGHRKQPTEWLRDVTVISVPLQAILEVNDPSLVIREYRYDVPPSDSAIMEQARELLRSTGATGMPTGVQGLHNSLLRLVTQSSTVAADEADNVEDELPRIEADDERLAQAWSLIEELEATFEDTRLNTLISIVRDAQTAHRPCVIMTRLTVECDYLSAALRSAGLSALILSGRASFEERDTIRSHFGPRETLVVTQELLDAVPAMAQPLVVVWSAARTRAKTLDLILRTTVWKGELVLMLPQPAAAEERSLADSIRELADAIASGSEILS